MLNFRGVEVLKKDFDHFLGFPSLLVRIFFLRVKRQATWLI